MTNRHVIDLLKHLEGLICSRYGVDTEIDPESQMLLIADGVETEIAVVCFHGMLGDEFDGTAFGFTAKKAFEKMLEKGYFELCSVRGTSEAAQSAINTMKELSKKLVTTDKK
jgi:hypothetical protein